MESCEYDLSEAKGCLQELRCCTSILQYKIKSNDVANRLCLFRGRLSNIQTRFSARSQRRVATMCPLALHFLCLFVCIVSIEKLENY
jgi:hypothetical protein